MALIYDARFRAIDDDGTLMPGATMTIYLANTTTLASVFTSATLATPLINPVVADADGWFPQFFAPLGGLYDALLKDASNVTVATYEALDALGSDSGAFVRTFDGSRISIDSGDIGDGTIGTNLEAGDPAPDVIGGVLRIGGWAGTPLDRLDLDATVANFSGNVNVAGHIEEKGKFLSEVLEGTYTAAAVTSLVIPLVNLPANVREWEIDLIDLFGQSSSTYLEAVFSFDGGITFKTGTSDYQFAEFVTQTGSTGGNQAANLGYIRVTEISPTVTGGSWLKARIITPISALLPAASMPTIFTADSSYYVPSSTTGIGIKTIGYCNGGYGRATHVKFVSAVGTFSCIARVRPQRGFGE